MTSGRPAARARTVTGTIAVASFVGMVAAFQIGANAGTAGTLSTSHGALAPATATPTATATAVPVPTAAPVAAPATATVTHSTTATKTAPAPVTAAPAPAPARVTHPVAKTKPSGG
jgi:hypothetical protein